MKNTEFRAAQPALEPRGPPCLSPAPPIQHLGFQSTRPKYPSSEKGAKGSCPSGETPRDVGAFYLTTDQCLRLPWTPGSRSESQPRDPEVTLSPSTSRGPVLGLLLGDEIPRLQGAGTSELPGKPERGRLSGADSAKQRGRSAACHPLPLHQLY